MPASGLPAKVRRCRGSSADGRRVSSQRGGVCTRSPGRRSRTFWADRLRGTDRVATTPESTVTLTEKGDRDPQAPFLVGQCQGVICTYIARKLFFPGFRQNHLTRQTRHLGSLSAAMTTHWGFAEGDSNDGGVRTFFGRASIRNRPTCLQPDAQQERWRALLHNAKWSSFGRHPSLQRSAHCRENVAPGFVRPALASDQPRETQ
jgi:hypothetical protein